VISTFFTIAMYALSSSLVVSPDQSKPSQVADPELAKRLGADERGMHEYYLVILKTGPKRVPDGPMRDEMFKGHFANIKRLADTGKLVVAGPFMDKGDWRGMFIFAVDTLEDARTLVSTDPVIINGEMVAEFHHLYCSAALVEIPNIHKRIAPQ
jgi:uncharacterized protein YciI